MTKDKEFRMLWGMMNEEEQGELLELMRTITGMDEQTRLPSVFDQWTEEDLKMMRRLRMFSIFSLIVAVGSFVLNLIRMTQLK